ncbi:Sarcosine dehydrogenase [Candidatus Rhodobacter oscarellae]|uniref:Sarcosine dehydrogenase n=1 Tax=Candidatus Rhodobacter oscarellae TaxID=1675527 RepID=A0A0J9E770_9RHOB|nr:FAD-dependent oxidoreductase [Candidatus Rhodobacter lobularis]KMW57614.1 Sarcosine dehydrogenase [Candidatus Rhodobacter lobularis]
MALPSSSKIVIIGGGIIGCSTAYHLAAMGQEVLLLEKAALTSGSTWHAAGLVGQLRSNANVTQLLGYSVELYAKLEAETGQATGWKQNGGLRLACNQERWTEVRRQATTARSFGLEMELLSPQEAQDLWPLMDVSDVVGAAFLPTDGQANPSDIAQALAKGARANDAHLVEHCPVTEILTEDGRLTGVRTTQGDVACEKLVLCCGQWTRDLAATIGVAVPLVSIEHQYMITEPMGVPSDLPTLRDPDRLTYWKEEVGGLVMGGYEPNPIPWAVGGLPDPFDFQLLESNFDHFEQITELALPRVPALQEAGIKQLLNGPESFTPDGNFILGEAPEMENVFVGAGFNAFGIASGGGAGMALAEWVANGAPPYDLWPVDIRRFGTPHRDLDWVRARTLEAYAKHYTMSWPAEEHRSARPYRRSPLYEILKTGGAVFGEKLGWERPNWFAAPGELAEDVYTYARPNWFKAVAREHRAARETAALFDQSSFAKFILRGPDAEAALGWVAANRVDVPVGRVVYTQMLNDHGGIECDLTCTRIAPDAYYIVTGTGFAAHDFHWVRRSIPKGMSAALEDVTDAFSVLSLFGPQARAILAAVTAADVSDAAIPFATAREIDIQGRAVRAIRITYVGEQGWELHMPIEDAPVIYEALLKAGGPLGLRNAGYRAIETLRLEKGYRAWGSDIGPDHTPLEAGLSWAVKLRTDQEFRGRRALEAQRAGGVKKMLASFTAAPEVILLGRETIYRDGARCGWLSSGGFGHTVGRAIGMGYVRCDAGVERDYVLSGAYELEVAGERVPAQVSLEPLYDPGSERLRG